MWAAVAQGTREKRVTGNPRVLADMGDSGVVWADTSSMVNPGRHAEPGVSGALQRTARAQGPGC